MTLKHTFIALALAVPALAQQTEWGQCGGIGWTGPTTCVAGTFCSQLNPYYYQCLPGTTTTTPPPVTTPPTTTPTTTPPTTTPPTTTPSSPTTTAAAGTCSTLPASLNLVSNSDLPDQCCAVKWQESMTKVTVTVKVNDSQ